MSIALMILIRSQLLRGASGQLLSQFLTLVQGKIYRLITVQNKN